VTESAAAYVASATEKVNAYLARLLPEQQRPETLFAAMNYSLLSPGKRLRPVFCMATANAFGVSDEDVIPAAVALELIHSYSLIHDDLPTLDNDDLRRGRLTNHKVYGEAMALLAGDGLLTYAFEQLSRPLPSVRADRQLQMIQVLARAAGCFGMVGGQVADVLAEETGGDAEDLAFIHLNKTAALIEASVHIGALFTSADDSQRDALCVYARRLGHAFQVVDDWLDVVGDPVVMGKQAGADAALHKLTYPTLIGLDATKTLASTLVTEALEALHDARIVAPVLEFLARSVTQRQK